MPREIEENDGHDEEELDAVGDFCERVSLDDDDDTNFDGLPFMTGGQVKRPIICPTCGTVDQVSAQGSCMKCGHEIPGAPVTSFEPKHPKRFVAFQTLCKPNGNPVIHAMRNDGRIFVYYHNASSNDWKALPECPQ